MLLVAVPEITRSPATIALLVGVAKVTAGGVVSWKVVAAVLNRISYAEYRALPETASIAALVNRTVIIVRPGRPAPPAVKVIVSPAADQANVPLTLGMVPKFVSTLDRFIGLLNCSTMGE